MRRASPCFRAALKAYEDRSKTRMIVLLPIVLHSLTTEEYTLSNRSIIETNHDGTGRWRNSFCNKTWNKACTKQCRPGLSMQNERSTLTTHSRCSVVTSIKKCGARNSSFNTAAERSERDVDVEASLSCGTTKTLFTHTWYSST